MKIPRFVKEYANFGIKCINSNELMQENYKKEKIKQIQKAVVALENGMITIDETMRTISEI